MEKPKLTAPFTKYDANKREKNNFTDSTAELRLKLGDALTDDVAETINKMLRQTYSAGYSHGRKEQFYDSQNGY